MKCCGVVVSAAISDSFLYTLLYFLFLLEEKTLFSHLDNNYYEIIKLGAVFACMHYI